MPTHKEVSRWVRRFRAEYPASLSERYRWWEEVVGIDRRLLLRLLGVPPGEESQKLSLPWGDLVTPGGVRDEGVERSLCELLWGFGYNWEVLRGYLGRVTPILPPESDENRFLLWELGRNPGTQLVREFLRGGWGTRKDPGDGDRDRDDV